MFQEKSNQQVNLILRSKDRIQKTEGRKEPKVGGQPIPEQHLADTCHTLALRTEQFSSYDQYKDS